MKRMSIAMGLVVAVVGAGLARGQGTPARLTTFYTHEGAEKLYHSAKYSDAEGLCKQAITEI